MPKSDFKKELRLIDSNCELLSEFINRDTKVDIICNKCGSVFSDKPSLIRMRKYACKNCSRKPNSTMKNIEIFKAELFKINPYIVITGKYTGANNKIEYYCSRCGDLGYASPSHLLEGKDCRCQLGRKIRESLSLPDSEFKYRLKNQFPNLNLIGKFISFSYDIDIHCNNCGYTFRISPKSIFVGCGCPKCNVRTISKAEGIIANELEANNIKFQLHKSFDNCRSDDGYKLNYDFFLPEQNILIEYNGIQHYEARDYFGGEEAFEKQQRHDAIKQEYALSNGFRFLSIPYTQFDNIHNILQEIINNISL